MSNYEVTVIRATYVAGKPVEKGATLTLDASAAKQLIDCGKAEMRNAFQVPEMHTEIAMAVSRRMQIDSRMITPKAGGMNSW